MSKKSVKKSKLASTPEEVWQIMGAVAKEHEKLKVAQQRTEAALASFSEETKSAQKRTEAAQQRTEAAQQRTEAAQQRTEAALASFSEETKSAQQRTEVAQQRTEAAQQRTEAALISFSEETKKSQKQTEAALASFSFETKTAQQQCTEKLLDQFIAGNEQLRKKLDRDHGNFNDKWGRFMENLVETDLTRVLNERGIEVWRTQTRLNFVDPRNRERRGEFDIVAFNGQQIVVTETKNTLRVQDVEYFEKNVKDFKILFPEYKNKVIFAAVAGMNIDPKAQKLAEEKGMFVIKAPSTHVKITTIQNPKDFKPKEF